MSQKTYMLWAAEVILLGAIAVFGTGFNEEIHDWAEEIHDWATAPSAAERHAREQRFEQRQEILTAEYTENRRLRDELAQAIDALAEYRCEIEYASLESDGPPNSFYGISSTSPNDLIISVVESDIHQPVTLEEILEIWERERQERQENMIRSRLFPIFRAKIYLEDGKVRARLHPRFIDRFSASYFSLNQPWKIEDRISKVKENLPIVCRESGLICDISGGSRYSGGKWIEYTNVDIHSEPINISEIILDTEKLNQFLDNLVEATNRVDEWLKAESL